MKQKVDKVNESPGAPEAPEVLEGIHAVMHRVRSRLHRDLRDSALELTLMDSRALAFVAQRPGATQRDLVARSGRDKGQVARLIAGLKERGLIESLVDAQDRRSTCLTLTPEGRRVHAALAEHRARLARDAVKGLTADELAVLQHLLQRLAVNLETPEGPGAAIDPP